MPGTYQLPNPNSPAASDALTSLPIRTNFQSIQSQINNADGAALQAKTVTENALADAINPRLAATNAKTSYVVSGFVMAVPGSGLNVTIPAGVAYVNGFYVNSVGAVVTIPASSDAYIDISTNGTFTVVSVANGATTGMTLTANSMRIAKIVSSASAVTTVTQTGVDPLYKPIYNTSPLALVSSFFSNQVQSFTNSGTAGGNFFYLNLGGIKLLWGTTAGIAVGGTGASIVFPSGFFNTLQSAVATVVPSSSFGQYANVVNQVVSSFLVSSQGSAGSPSINVFIIGT